jgi:hypothetical protein
MHRDFSGCEIGFKQIAFENVDPPGRIGRGIVARTLAEMATPVMQDRGGDLLEPILHVSSSQSAENR